MSIEKAAKDTINPDWQVTITTVQCDAVAHEATLLVYKDWHASCAYYKRFGGVRHQTRRGIGAVLAWLGVVSHEKCLPCDCPGPEGCSYIKDYRQRLREELREGQIDPEDPAG